MLSFLGSTGIKPPRQSRDMNAINGSDAETFAASMLVTACLGEVRWGSREEDGKKIDLMLSSNHPWVTDDRLTLLVQVKSGATYGEISEKGFKLKTAAISAAKRTSHSICVVWVDRDTAKSYWAYIHPDTLVANGNYGDHHTIDPATLYDLARCHAKPFNRNFGGSGIIVRERLGDFKLRRANALKKYRTLKETISPVLGKIEFTRYGWRHMFRSGRLSQHKQSTINIIPYLHHILQQHPSYHALTDCKRWEADGYLYRSTEHLLRFSKIYTKKHGEAQKRGEVIIKVTEEIRFPKNWRDDAMLSQKVNRRVILKSAYSK